MSMNQAGERIAQAKLIQAIRDLIKREAEIREECGVGENLRVVRNTLNALLKNLEDHTDLIIVSDEPANPAGGADIKVGEKQALVYLYLFNAKGLQLAPWGTMLAERLLYEYSVNRPVYAEKKQVTAFIGSKPHPGRHAFLTFKIAEDCIVSGSKSNSDSIGQPLLNLKEGAFCFDNLVEFTLQGRNYAYTKGRLVLKQD
jgi:hypothetical protein